MNGGFPEMVKRVVQAPDAALNFGSGMNSVQADMAGSLPKQPEIEIESRFRAAHPPEQLFMPGEFITIMAWVFG